MNAFTRKAIVTGLMLAGAQAAVAGTDVYFNPLVQGAPVAQVPNHIDELNNPWQMPAGVTATNLTSLHEIESDPSQSTVRVPGLGTNASMTDMAAFDPTGRYIFLPHETQCGAGVTRYDTVTDKATNLLHGDQAGCNVSPDWSNDYGAFDPATWTPMDTLLLGEEWSGQGRIFELQNPMVDVNAGETPVLVELNSIPNVSHEGLRFNHAGTALYFIDEDKSGSIYKFVPSIAGDYSKGQSFVLSVAAFAGDVTKNWDAAVNAGQPRTGLAAWIPLTDADGVALPGIADPFDNATRGGRAAADTANGTPFGRPEDVEVGYLGNGNEVLYFNATSERAIYSVEELGNGQATVRLMASNATPKNLGYGNVSGELHDVDNLAQDALGNIYTVEDWPNGGNTGGDIWFVRDTNNDGVAESMDRFLSLQVKGAENTGMIFRPGHPTQFIVNVQHPDSVGVSGGMGDATWLFDVKDVVAPPCVARPAHGGVRTCNPENEANFVRKLTQAGR
ncbi:MAG: DUF839 domain-containing protein [Gammaproteobacteria bacterium]|nr:DUF839 domain-containing protein [Gammaproteobacteria bacterium]